MRKKYQAKFIILLTISVITCSIWALANRPYIEPEWSEPVAGFSFSPFQQGQSPVDGVFPSVESIQADIALISHHTSAIRTYSVTGTLNYTPILAKSYGLDVTLGAWITGDRVEDYKELDRLIEIANSHDNVTRLIVGNEAILRKDIQLLELIEYLDYVKASVKVPVSTAETWNYWLKTPELARHVDYIAAHILPYWEGIHVSSAVDYVATHSQELREAYPGKPLLLAETGWPSRGRVRGEAVASVANQGIFLRNFIVMAKDTSLDYFIMEAFDQPWKEVNEGAVGAYWGVFNADRDAKFPFQGPILNVPQWGFLVAISIVLAILTIAVLLRDGDMFRKRAISFLSCVVFICMTTLVWMVYDFSTQYISWQAVLLGIMLCVSALCVTLVVLVEAHEWAEALWVKQRRRPFSGSDCDRAKNFKVSIHVPCYNEPPEMVIQTLKALAALKGANYEVLVVDNNTKDPDVWAPVKAFCETLGEPFRFFHESPLAGFKGGALNFALRHTAEDADIVAVIDSDYIVSPEWLSDLVPHFTDPKIGVVQAPQDYRDGDENLFKSMCYAEYRGFFHIGMVTRNDRNAIIEHGTMTMIRRSLLNELGGWGEWSITEDAELGLRVFDQGYEAAYIEQSYGKGLIPDTFIDFKKQRFRWAYGAIQIMREHAAKLWLGKHTQLTQGQRYHFIAGWLPWVADAMNLFFTAGALFWSLMMILFPEQSDPPLILFAFPPLALFFFKIGKLVHLYRIRVNTDAKDTLSAALAGLALSYTISKAVIYGLIYKKMPFIRTPKLKDQASIRTAILSAWEEILILMMLLGAVVGVCVQQDIAATDTLVWVVVLLVQSQAYAAALVMSVISALPDREVVPSQVNELVR